MNWQTDRVYSLIAILWGRSKYVTANKTMVKRRDLGRWYDGEGVHDAVGVLLADLADQQRAHARPGAAT